MALSTEFAMPNATFDPTRYGRKSAAHRARVIDTIAKPETEAVSPISWEEKPSEAETVNSIHRPTDGEATIENSGFSTDAAHPVETQQITSATKVPIAEEDEQPTTMRKTEVERHVSEKPSQQACTKPGGAKHASTAEVARQVEGQISISDLKAEPTRSDSRDIQFYPATLFTAKNFDSSSFSAPNDVEVTDTCRLVSIRRIRNIRQAKIGNRWLTLAQVDEWTCTVPRHAFREGELVVYVEIDAFLPSADRRFGIMSSLQTYDGILGHRVKTRRFGSYPDKLVVQGYIYPLEKFEEVFQEIDCIRQVLRHDSISKSSQKMVKELICAMYRHEDWAAKIGVKKWEEPNPTNNPNRHAKLGAVPTRVFRKTDITHFEDCPNLFTKNKYFSREYQESIKMDGASMTVYFVKKTTRSYYDLNELPEEVGPNMVLDNGRFGVTSKSVDLNELSACAFGYWKTALKNDLPAKLSKLDRSIAIQGEICGPGINQNREKLDETDFFVYSMWDITTQKYIDPRKVQALAQKIGLKHVPVLGYVKIRDIASNHNDLRNLADKRPGEGLVYKCVRDGRSFKVHSPAYKVLHNC